MLGWAEQLQTLRKLYQGAEMGLTELQNKYRAAKKTAGRYKLWADGKERHIQQEWQRIVVGLQNVLQGVQVKVQTALTDSTVTDSTVTDSTEHTHLKVALLCGYWISYASIATYEQLHQTVFIMYRRYVQQMVCQFPSFERPMLCHVTLIFITVCSNPLCLPDCHFKTLPNQSAVYIPCTTNHLSSPLRFPTFHCPDNH